MLKNQLWVLTAPLRGVEKCCSPFKELQYLKGPVIFFLSNDCFCIGLLNETSYSKIIKKFVVHIIT